MQNSKMEDQYPLSEHKNPKKAKSKQELAKVKTALEATRVERNHWRQKARSLQRALLRERTQREALATRVQDVYASYSWRFTAPMRKVMQTLCSLSKIRIRYPIKPVVTVQTKQRTRSRRVLKFFMARLSHMPKLKHFLRLVVACFPPLEKRLTKTWREAQWADILTYEDYQPEPMTANRMLEGTMKTSPKKRCIYYWVDHTCNYPANSGIQRVVRGLARELQNIGVPLVPVKWNNESHFFYLPGGKEMIHLAAWNGPDPARFSRFTMSGDESGSWLLVPELTSYLGDTGLEEVVRKAKSIGLHIAIIFYDALPYKLAQFYPPEATMAHTDYMKKLINFDCVLPISNASSADLQAFLIQHGNKLVNINKKLNPVILPGEFLEHPRVTTYKEPETSTIRILCVSTIEPRKNHLVLLKSFDKISREESIDMELILVGHCPYPELEEKVNKFLKRNRRIQWLRNVDDATLGKEYSQCHFTVYPSMDEGFGLPVLESLWYARPCICRNTGALAETAEGGGCLTVDTSKIEELARVMKLLASDKEIRARLGAEAVSRHFKTWNEYAWEILNHLARRTGKYTLEPLVKPASWPPKEAMKQFLQWK
jgi:glycosyltransferase involved in cell wall biosynthesis